jgi:hypothetical protein
VRTSEFDVAASAIETQAEGIATIMSRTERINATERLASEQIIGFASSK